MLKAGCSEVEITPPVGGWLVGPMGISTGVHDPLMAKALALEAGGERVILVALDLVALAEELSAELREGVGRRCDVDPRRVIAMCSHTHSAPFTVAWSVVGWASFQRKERGWFSGIVSKVAEAAAAACRRLAEVRLGYARAPVQIGMNRRLGGGHGDSQAAMKPNPNGPVVPWSDVLRFDDSNGEVRILLFSQASHPVMIHKASPLISADYPAFASARIRQRLGDNVMPIFAQGCGADNNAPLAVGFEQCRAAAYRLGDAVVSACRQAVPVEVDRLRLRSGTVEIPMRACESEATLQHRVERERAYHASGKADDPGRLDMLAVFEDKLAKARRGALAASMPYEINVLAIGDRLAIVAMSHEPFGAYQLAIDKASPFKHTAVWGYCNACENYVATAAEIPRGGYEINGGPLGYRHRCGPADAAEGLILGEAARLLKEAKAADEGGAGRLPTAAGT